MTYVNGDVYEGSWKDGELDGKGKMTYKKDGDIYEGEWVRGNFHREGTYTSTELDMSFTYKGRFENGKRHTEDNKEGSMTYSRNGKIYKRYDGSFKNNLCH